MISRIVEKGKNSITFAIELAPGIALVCSRSGGAEFNWDNFYSHIKEALGKENVAKGQIPLQIMNVLLSTGFFAANVATVVTTRVFNLIRKNKTLEAPPSYELEEVKYEEETDSLLIESPLAIESEDDELHFPIRPEPESTLGLKVISSITWVAGHGYRIGSAGTGFLGMRSLVNLAQKWFNFEYSGRCGQNADYSWLAITAGSLLLAYANNNSSRKYTLPRLPLCTEVLFEKEGWKELHPWDYFTLFLGTSLSSVGVFYCVGPILDLMVNENICHPGGFGEVEIPNYIIYTLSSLYAISNLIVTLNMTSLAMLDSSKKKPEYEKENLPSEFGKGRKVLDAARVVDAVNNGLGTYNAVLLLIDIFMGKVKQAKSLTYSIGSSLVGGLFAIVGGYNQNQLNKYGTEVEEKARRREREDAAIGQWTAVPTSPSQAYDFKASYGISIDSFARDHKQEEKHSLLAVPHDPRMFNRTPLKRNQSIGKWLNDAVVLTPATSPDTTPRRRRR